MTCMYSHLVFSASLTQANLKTPIVLLTFVGNKYIVLFRKQCIKEKLPYTSPLGL